jgi:hypothetical protein
MQGMRGVAHMVFLILSSVSHFYDFVNGRPRPSSSPGVFHIGPTRSAETLTMENHGGKPSLEFFPAFFHTLHQKKRKMVKVV